MHPPRSPDAARRRGYTLIELLVVNILMTLLVVLIAGAWRAFGPLCVEVIARGRIVNEANLAAQAIYQDMNNTPQSYSLAKVETLDGTSLQLDYSIGGLLSGNDQYPYTIVYSLQTPQDPPGSTEIVLNRSAGDGSTSMTIARHLQSATASNITIDSTGKHTEVQYSVTYAYRGSQSQYTFAVHN